MSDSIQVRGRQELNRLEGGVLFSTLPNPQYFIFNTFSSAQNTPCSVVCVPHSRDFIRWLVLEAECPWVSRCPDEEALNETILS